MEEPAQESTESVRTGRRVTRIPTEPFLFVVLAADRPLAGGFRVPLHGVSEVSIARGSGRAPLLVERASGERVLELPDRGVSSTHAHLRCVHGNWVVVDRASKNGTFLDGQRVAEAPLADGAFLEVGHTFLRFRANVPVPPGHGGALDASRTDAPSQGLSTLLPSLAAEFERLATIGRSRVSVLIGGESGSGKEVVATAIHEISHRPGAFQAVNCGALPKDIVEAELFGHRKGAFSGAVDDRPGLVRSADRGTLFLDEIGDLPEQAQPKLLRVLQQCEVTPVGGTQPLRVDLRVVSATHRPLETLAKAGYFRHDLLARLAGYSLVLPPLRARREDLGIIVASLLRKHAEDSADVALTPSAARALLWYDWPLNVRELEKALAAACVLARGEPIEVAHLPEAVRAAAHPPAPPTEAAGPPAAPSRLSPEDEKLHAELLALFEKHRGNLTAIAAAMGKRRVQIQRWKKRFKIDAASYRR